jgi:hypothetical protein
MRKQLRPKYLLDDGVNRSAEPRLQGAGADDVTDIPTRSGYSSE